MAKRHPHESKGKGCGGGRGWIVDLFWCNSETRRWRMYHTYCNTLSTFWLMPHTHIHTYTCDHRRTKEFNTQWYKINNSVFTTLKYCPPSRPTLLFYSSPFSGLASPSVVCLQVPPTPPAQDPVSIISRACIWLLTLKLNELLTFLTSQQSTIPLFTRTWQSNNTSRYYCAHLCIYSISNYIHFHHSYLLLRFSHCFLV